MKTNNYFLRTKYVFQENKIIVFKYLPAIAASPSPVPPTSFQNTTLVHLLTKNVDQVPFSKLKHLYSILPIINANVSSRIKYLVKKYSM